MSGPQFSSHPSTSWLLFSGSGACGGAGGCGGTGAGGGGGGAGVGGGVGPGGVGAGVGTGVAGQSEVPLHLWVKSVLHKPPEP